MPNPSTSPQTDTGPFALVPEWILVSEISDRALRLYVILSRYADRDTGKSFPSRRTLATRLRCSVNTVDRALKELIDSGALRKEARYTEAGDNSSNLYIVARVQPGSPTDEATSPQSEGDGSPTAAAQNKNQDEREPEDREEPSAAVAAVEYDPLKGKRVGAALRNVPWDALVEATGANEDSEGGRIGRALQKIRRYVVADFQQGEEPTPHDVMLQDPERYERQIGIEIWARRQAYIGRWPGAELTPTALANNWHRVLAPRPGEDPAAAERAAQEGIDAARRAS